MGIFMSRLSNSANSKIWGFDQRLAFRESQIKQNQTAGAAKQAEMLAQLPFGGGGGGGGGGANNTPQGGQIQGQLNLTKFLATIAPVSAILGIALSVVAYIQNLDRGIMFIGLTSACFFSMFLLSFMFNVSQTNNMSSGPMMTASTFMSVLVAFVVSFLLYEPEDDVAAKGTDLQLSPAEIALLKMKAREAANK